MFDVITIFDTCVDLVLNLGDTVPEFDQKEKFIESFSLEMGGSACIFACQCAKLSLKTSGAGIVGMDVFGHLMVEKLTEAGVNLDNLKIDENQNTALGTLLTRGRDRAILTYNGTIGAVTPDMITDEFLKSAKHLHVASYYLLQGVHNDIPDIIKRAKSFGLTISLDTNWDPHEKWHLPKEIIDNLDIFLPNENEILYLSGKDNIEDAIKYFSHIPIVALKQGSDGATVYSKGEIISLPAYDVAVVDTVGAGDSFDGGFIYGYLKGLSVRECLAAGIFCGSMNTRATGGVASQVNFSELDAYLKVGDFGV